MFVSVFTWFISAFGSLLNMMSTINITGNISIMDCTIVYAFAYFAVKLIRHILHADDTAGDGK